MSSEKFWLEEPCVLLQSWSIIPDSGMTNAERLNSLTRLLLIITAGMYLLGYENYFTVLALGLLLIIVLRSQIKEGFVSERAALDSGIRSFDPTYDSRPHVRNPKTDACWFDQNTSLLNAKFEVTPNIQFNHDDAAKRSYMNTKYELTPLTPAEGFTQIWRTEPEMCGGYSMVPDPLTEFPVDEVPHRGQCNYIVRSTIDHLPISQAQNDLNSTRPIAEDAFSQSILDFRSSIMNAHLDRFRRERQHNCADMKLNTASAGSGGSI